MIKENKKSKGKRNFHDGEIFFSLLFFFRGNKKIFQENEKRKKFLKADGGKKMKRFL